MAKYVPHSTHAMVQQPGAMALLADVTAHPNDIWFVDSGHTLATDSASYGRARGTPFATLVYAVSQAAADDVIYVMPGHTETLTGSPSLTLALAGLQIKCLGGWSRKPIFLIDGANTAHVSITGADTGFINASFSAGHADIAKAINVAAVGVNLQGCKFIENVATENFLICVLTGGANTADGLWVNNCHCVQPDGSNTHFISHPNAQEGVQHCRNIIFGVHTTASIGAVGTITNCRIVDNEINNAEVANDVIINLAAGSTGLIGRNGGASAAAAQAASMTATATGMWENYFGLIAEDLQGILDPTDT